MKGSDRSFGRHDDGPASPSVSSPNGRERRSPLSRGSKRGSTERRLRSRPSVGRGVRFRSDPSDRSERRFGLARGFREPSFEPGGSGATARIGRALRPRGPGGAGPCSSLSSGRCNGCSKILQAHRGPVHPYRRIPAVIYGSPYITTDIDWYPRGTPENLMRLSAALRAMNARVWTATEPEGIPFGHEPPPRGSSSVEPRDRPGRNLDLTFEPQWHDRVRGPCPRGGPARRPRGRGPWLLSRTSCGPRRRRTERRTGWSFPCSAGCSDGSRARKVQGSPEL